MKTLSNPNFYAIIEEKTSGILSVPSGLKRGKFPPATLPGRIWEASMVLTWERRFGNKTVVLPFCETAGEDMEFMVGPHADKVYTQKPNWRVDTQIVNYITNSCGYIVAVNVAAAKMFNGESIENEPENMAEDPDVNIRRILASILHYKRNNPRSPKIKGIAILLTKYDKIDTHLKARGMNLYDPEGAKQFLHTYFQMTSALLEAPELRGKVRFFPVWVQEEKKENKDGDVTFTGRILTDPQRNLPLFSEKTYLEIIDWTHEVFAH